MCILVGWCSSFRHLLNCMTGTAEGRGLPVLCVCIGVLAWMGWLAWLMERGSKTPFPVSSEQVYFGMAVIFCMMVGFSHRLINHAICSLCVCFWRWGPAAVWGYRSWSVSHTRVEQPHAQVCNSLFLIQNTVNGNQAESAVDLTNGKCHHGRLSFHLSNVLPQGLATLSPKYETIGRANRCEQMQGHLMAPWNSTGQSC